MKKRIIHLILAAAAPLLGYAQVDDMYFVPQKQDKTARQTEEKPATPVLRETDRAFEVRNTGSYAAAASRDVDEYNRRYRHDDYSAADTTLTDVVDTDGQWVNGFQGSESDYAYTKRILRFCTPSVGIPVSSPLYWDLCYGPNSIYWNVYDDGVYAYAFPSSWNSWYYSPYFSYSWGWHPYYSYWGWGHPWYGGWYSPWYGHHWHYAPHWGWGHHPGGSVPGGHRPVSRPSVRYRENSPLAIGAQRGTATRSSLPSTRGTRSSASPGRSTTTGSSSRTSATRSSSGSAGRSSAPVSRGSYSGSQPMRSGGGGGFSPSRSGGSMSRGRR